MMAGAGMSGLPNVAGAVAGLALGLMLAGGLAACASAVPSTAVQLEPVATDRAAVLKLDKAAEIRLPTGYLRFLPAASRWQRVGRLPQGDVYRPVDTVFTIEGRHVHEAYLVVSAGSLVGFYLPGESGYSGLIRPVPLSFGDN
jgi:hypothetical protein